MKKLHRNGIFWGFTYFFEFLVITLWEIILFFGAGGGTEIVTNLFADKIGSRQKNSTTPRQKKLWNDNWLVTKYQKKSHTIERSEVSGVNSRSGSLGGSRGCIFLSSFFTELYRQGSSPGLLGKENCEQLEHKS